MSSYLSSLKNNYSSLRRLLPNSLSEDSDLQITSPEDSHVSRVLRAYYTEKGRPFPPWLGPDPNAKAIPPPALINFPQQSSSGSLRTANRGLQGNRGSSGLGDLFADAPSNASSTDSLNLRSQRRPGLRSPGFQSNSSDAIPYPQRAVQPPPPPTVSQSIPNVRPLPSQLKGSYQARQGAGTPPQGRSSPGGEAGTVQERLKARLGGGGGRETPPPPGSSGSTGGSYGSGGGGYNPYETGGGGGGSRNPYASMSDDLVAYSGSGGQKPGGARPYVAAGSPWVSGDGAAGGGGSGGYDGGPPQLGRRGPGLPSSPRRRG